MNKTGKKIKLSVVISAHNEEKRIREVLEAVFFADEIIIVDNASTDATKNICKEFTKKIFSRPNFQMLNKNKNYGFSKASNEWILNLDADEIITPELREEIISAISKSNSVDGYCIPRKNMILGKWIAHTGWYPDYQLRLFKKGKGKFAERHVHEKIDLNGTTENLKNPMIHKSYNSLDQFLQKMMSNYTISEAENLIAKGYEPKLIDSLLFPSGEFLKRFFLEEGYKDGAHGLILSLLMAFYHLVVFARVWEMKNYPDNENALNVFQQGSSQILKDTSYWINYEREKGMSPAKRALSKLKRKLHI